MNHATYQLFEFRYSSGDLPTCCSNEEVLEMPDEWFEFNSFIKIGGNGAVNLMSPNPEFGSNVKTSMPMILADELDVDWKNIIVEQADFYPERFDRQFTGGSQGIRQGWKPLRTAGATARQMLINAAAQQWNVAAEEITTGKPLFTIDHKAEGMLIAMIVHPPFGMMINSVDDAAARPSGNI